jgi:hypothetical protein
LPFAYFVISADLEQEEIRVLRGRESHLLPGPLYAGFSPGR